MLRVNGGSSSRSPEGMRKWASPLSHRKIQRGPWELVLCCRPQPHDLLLTSFCSPTTSSGCGSCTIKMLEKGSILLDVLNQLLVLFRGIFKRLHVTCVTPTPLAVHLSQTFSTDFQLFLVYSDARLKSSSSSVPSQALPEMSSQS